MDIITWIIVGLIAGLLASALVGYGLGLVGDCLLGILGAFVGSWLFTALGWRAPFTGLASIIVVATLGAVICLAVLRLVRYQRRPIVRA